jgi:formate dehydrogenase major subunit
MALDPSSHIQEVKALTVDIQPGRRPRGPARIQLIGDHRRAGIQPRSGMKPRSTR